MGINKIIQIGFRIKDLRKKNTTLSQREMAKLLGIPVSTYSNYENNHREPPKDTIEKIAEILGVSVDRLLGIELDPNEALEMRHDTMFGLAGFELDSLEDGSYMISNYEEKYYFYASKKEVESIINNTLGLLAYELEKLKKTKEVVYEDPDTKK